MSAEPSMSGHAEPPAPDDVADPTSTLSDDDDDDNPSESSSILDSSESDVSALEHGNIENDRTADDSNAPGDENEPMALGENGPMRRREHVDDRGALNFERSPNERQSDDHEELNFEITLNHDDSGGLSPNHGESSVVDLQALNSEESPLSYIGDAADKKKSEKPTAVESTGNGYDRGDPNVRKPSSRGISHDRRNNHSDLNDRRQPNAQRMPSRGIRKHLEPVPWRPTIGLLELAYRLKQTEFRMFGRLPRFPTEEAAFNGNSKNLKAAAKKRLHDFSPDSFSEVDEDVDDSMRSNDAFNRWGRVEERRSAKTAPSLRLRPANASTRRDDIRLRQEAISAGQKGFTTLRDEMVHFDASVAVSPKGTNLSSSQQCTAVGELQDIAKNSHPTQSYDSSKKRIEKSNDTIRQETTRPAKSVDLYDLYGVPRLTESAADQYERYGIPKPVEEIDPAEPSSIANPPESIDPYERYGIPRHIENFGLGISAADGDNTPDRDAGSRRESLGFDASPNDADKPTRMGCLYCAYRTNSQTQLRKHELRMHGNGTEGDVPDDASLPPDTMLPPGARRHHCPSCAYQTDSRSHYRRHVETVHSAERPFRCHVCLGEFVGRGDIKDHFAVVHPGVPYEASMARGPGGIPTVVTAAAGGSKAPVSVARDAARRDGAPDDPAGPDGSEDSDLAALVAAAVAARDAEGEATRGFARPYCCTTCTYSSRDLWHLRRHIGDVHLKRRNHRCKVCRYATGRADRLVQHMQMHGEMFCLYCDYSSAHMEAYRAHAQTCAASAAGGVGGGNSGGARPVGLGDGRGEGRGDGDEFESRGRGETSEQERTCRLCNVLFSTCDDFGAHIDAVHTTDVCAVGAPALSCKTCGWESESRGAMREHVATHGVETFACDVEGCEFKATYARTLELHQRYYHTESIGRGRGRWGDYYDSRKDRKKPESGGGERRQKKKDPGVEMQNEGIGGGADGEKRKKRSEGGIGLTASSGGKRSKATAIDVKIETPFEFLPEAGGYGNAMENAAFSAVMDASSAYLSSTYPASYSSAAAYSSSPYSSSAATYASSGGYSTTAHSSHSASAYSGSAYSGSAHVAGSHASAGYSPVTAGQESTASLGLFACPICVDRPPFKYRRSYEKHMLQHRGGSGGGDGMGGGGGGVRGGYVGAVQHCMLCGESFLMPGELQAHMLWAHGHHGGHQGGHHGAH